jgi:hypothetical protein
VHEQWDNIDLFTRVADLGLQKIHKCRYPVRTILVETVNARGRMDYFNVFTHFQPEVMSGPEVFHYYNARQTIEALIKGEKYSLQITPMKTRSFAGNYAFLYFAAIVFNLLAWFKHHILKGTDLEHLGLNDLTSKFMQIPAQFQYKNNQIELAFPSLVFDRYQLDPDTAASALNLQHQADSGRVKLEFTRSRRQRRPFRRLQATFERPVGYRGGLGKAENLGHIFGNALGKFLLIRRSDLRLGEHDNAGCRSVNAGFPRAFGAHDDAVLDLLGVLTEIPGVAVFVLGVPVESVFYKLAV